MVSSEVRIIKIPRSDGQDTGPGYWPNSNDPKKTTKDASEKTPRAKPQMVRLAEDDPRFVEWRVKLGLLLKQELAPMGQDQLSWYVEFPRNYWLYEKSKHLWVSGYPVKSKLYKTPQDFGVHLLWLIGGSQDRKDCACIHCNPPKVEELIVTDPIATTNLAGASLKATKPTSKIPKTPQSATSTPPQQAAATPASNMAGPLPTQANAQSNPGPAPQPQPQPAGPAAPSEQGLVPFQPPKSPLMFRIGELVWYKVAQSWRIGLIARSDPSTQKHHILPISHALLHTNQLQPTDPTDVRPFLAFTVPPVAVPEIADKSFDDIDWQTVISSHPTKRDAILLDASKLGAIKISRSFSFFTHLATSEQGRKIDYMGVFLGGERIEVGDTVRARIKSEESTNNTNPATPEFQDGYLGLREICTATVMPGSVFFKGDIYLAIKGDASDPAGAVIVPPEKLPTALQEEHAFRAQFAPASRWRIACIRSNAVLQESDIRGRYYPSRRLLPVLMHPNNTQLMQEFQQGVIRESDRQLNQRVDTFKSGYIGRKANRADMIGAAVPNGSAAVFAYEPAVVVEEDA